MERAGETSGFNVAQELIGNNARVRGDKVAIYCGETTVSYKQLEENVNRFANMLRSMGVLPTERVVLMLPDSPMFVYAFLGSIKHGAWPVPVNTMLQPDDYRYLLTDSDARLLITTKGSNAAAGNTDPPVETLFADESLEQRLAAQSTQAEPHLVNADDIAFWLYSSGSTGKPKGAPHKHVSMLFTADNYAKNVLNISENDVCFSVSKLFFAYGLGNNLTFPLRFGASAVLLSEAPTPDKVIETLLKFRPTVFFGVPTQYNSVLKKMDGTNLSSLRACVSAGEALPPEIYKQWKTKTNLDILDGIGSTEALHIFISNRSDDVREGTSGKMVPGCEAKVVDSDGNPVPPAETGHLLIRGQSLTPGYWNRPEVNADKFLEGGWFKTGDMYSQENGYFTYQGRGDDMLKVGGIWVSPMEIEYALVEHGAVNECAVVGHDVEGLSKPFAYVVLHEPCDWAAKEQLSRELIEFVAAKLPKFKRPWGIHFVKELPKTATGKIQRFKLRQRN
jgi:benzoate-CoA ligase family protein